MANNKRFFKTISLAHWHVKLSIAAQLPMVLSFRWEQTCELVINVKNNVMLIIFTHSESTLFNNLLSCNKLPAVSNFQSKVKEIEHVAHERQARSENIGRQD